MGIASVSDLFSILDWIARVEVDKEGGRVCHVLCNDAATLVYLAGQACITPHVWSSRVDRLRRPDRLVFDLDPSSDDVESVRAAARSVRRLLDEVGLTSVVMTTGSRGFHVVVPLRPEHDHDSVRDLARDLAGLLVERDPDRLTVEQRKAKRGARVFVDILRNAYAQTTVAPYAVRAREGAPVATPIDWDELDGVTPRSFTVENLFRRLGQKDDPWEGLGRSAQDTGRARSRLAELRRDRRSDS